MVCAVIAVVVSYIVNVIMLPSEDELAEKFSKLWSRIQKIESLADKDRKFFDGEFTRFAKGLTQTRSVMTTLTGYKSLDVNDKKNHIVAVNNKNQYFLLDLNFCPAKMIPMKIKTNNKDSDLEEVNIHGITLEYKKPVDTDF